MQPRTESKRNSNKPGASLTIATVKLDFNVKMVIVGVGHTEKMRSRILHAPLILYNHGPEISCLVAS